MRVLAIRFGFVLALTSLGVGCPVDVLGILPGDAGSPKRDAATRDDSASPMPDATRDVAAPSRDAGIDAPVDGGHMMGSDAEVDGDRDASAPHDSGRDSARDAPVDAPTWTPADISGLLLWLRSDVGVETSDGGISVWHDQSGHGYDVGQPVPSQRPSYDTAGTYPLIQSTGGSTQGLLNSGFPSVVPPFELFAIVNSAGTDPASTNFFIVDFTPTGERALLEKYGTDQVALAGNDTYITGSGFPAGDGVVLVDAIINGSSSSVALDNGQAFVGDLGTAATTGGVAIGNNYPLGAYAWGSGIYEIVITGTPLSATTKASLAGYVKSRYGIGP